MRRFSISKIKDFQKEVWRYYRLHKREFPWRETKIPYRILVSEIMLQQTQAGRVVAKYTEFIKFFPSFSALAKATLKNVLRTWQGLGYNRRAVHLKAIAREVMGRFDGKLPHDTEALLNLPGIGQSTVGAIQAFAFNKPAGFIETNIRTVFILLFFPKKRTVSDANISEIIVATLDRKNPREWYWALMDYGAMLKKLNGNSAARRSAQYIKQSPFKGSSREERAKILRAILNGKTSMQVLAKEGFSKRSLRKHLAGLEKDGFIIKEGNYHIVSR